MIKKYSCIHLLTIECINKDMIYKFKLAINGFPYLTLFEQIVITSALQHD